MKASTSLTLHTKISILMVTGTVFLICAISKPKINIVTLLNSWDSTKAVTFLSKCKKGTIKRFTMRKKSCSKVQSKEKIKLEVISSEKNNPPWLSPELVESLTSSHRNLFLLRRFPLNPCLHSFFKAQPPVRSGPMSKLRSNKLILIRSKLLISSIVGLKMHGFLSFFRMKMKWEICFWGRKLKMLKLGLYKEFKTFGRFMLKEPLS